MDIAERMKSYEHTWRRRLMPKTPIILRLDGKAFHSYLAPLKDRYDFEFSHLMQQVTLHLQSEIQGCVFGYTQSDEISLLICDWQTYQTQQPYGGVQNKLESISAAMATGYFNFIKGRLDYIKDVKHDYAMFDSRAFSLPVNEVVNYFIWRQQDATRNSINVLGQMYFSAKQLQGKSVNAVQDMVFKKHDINWNDLDSWKKRGVCTYQGIVDVEPPIFTQEREYIERHMIFTEEIQ